MQGTAVRLQAIVVNHAVDGIDMVMCMDMVHCSGGVSFSGDRVSFSGAQASYGTSLQRKRGKSSAGWCTACIIMDKDFQAVFNGQQ